MRMLLTPVYAGTLSLLTLATGCVRAHRWLLKAILQVFAFHLCPHAAATPLPLRM